MPIGLLIVGTACLVVGGYSVAMRDRIVARLTARPNAVRVQASAAYAVVGVILAVMGVVFILAALL